MQSHCFIFISIPYQPWYNYNTPHAVGIFDLVASQQIVGSCAVYVLLTTTAVNECTTSESLSFKVH